MFKKIIVGALLVGVIGVLVAGAVNRTNAKVGDGTASEAGRRGRATAVVTDANQQNYGGRGNETGASQGGRWAQDSAVEQARGGQGGGRGVRGGQAVAGDSQNTPLADVAAADWLVVPGTVSSAADNLVEIETAAGEVIPFEGQPLSFARGQGFSLKVGDKVTLAGYDENGEFKIGKITNLNSGMSITLRDTSGRPGWAGGGRRG